LNVFKKKGCLAFHPDKGGSDKAMRIFERAYKFYEDNCADERWVKVYSDVCKRLEVEDGNSLIRDLVHWEEL